MQSLQESYQRFLFIAGAMVLPLFVLSGCSQFVTKTDESPTSDVPAKEVAKESKAAEVKKPKVIPPNLPAKTMYQLMVAEMLVQKGQNSAAFGLLYPIAKETRDPELAERVFQLSMATYDVNAIKESTVLWRDVSPQEPMAWKASYLMDVREGKLDAAMQAWDHYRSLSKQSLERDLISASVRIGQTAPPTSGIGFLQRLQLRYPDEKGALFGLGSAAEAYKQYGIAIEYLEKARDAYQDDAEAELEEQPTVSEAVNQLSALKIYREANHLLANAYLKSNQILPGLDRLKEYVDEYPDDWKMQERYARLEVKAGLFRQAEKRYQQVLDNEPKAYGSMLSVALLRLERKDYAVAEGYLKQLEKRPFYRSTAVYYLGVSAQEQGRFDEAKYFFTQIDSADYLVDAQLHLAELDFPTVGIEPTIARLNAIKTTSKKDELKILRAMAIFYSLSDMPLKAVAAYDDAIALDQTKVDLYLSQAMLYYDLKRFDEYEVNLNKALALNPNDVDALNALGYFYAEQNRNLELATRLLDKAESLAPNRYYILDSQGWLAYQKEDYETAETYLEKAIGLHMDDEVLLHLIQTKWRLNKIDDAQSLWEANHQKYPENKRLQNILNELGIEAD